jgi:hypothetical protein
LLVQQEYRPPEITARRPSCGYPVDERVDDIRPGEQVRR